MKLYIGNLPYSIRDNDLKSLFERFGEIVSAAVIMERDSNRSKGFGFVEFGTDDAASNAKKEMDGAEVEGRTLKVDFARPRA